MGVSQYADGDVNLNMPLKDAADFAKLLKLRKENH
jgi:hypothetical protein